jgi:hypothetical protein
MDAMAHSSTARRTLFMHAAHRSVGILSDRATARPYCPIEPFSIADATAAPLQVALASFRQSADVASIQALFEQAVRQSVEIECCRVELDAAAASFDCLPGADCVVVFDRGLHMARHWSDLDVADLANDESGDCPNFHVNENGTVPFAEVEVVPDNDWHPVLMGVEPFRSDWNFSPLRAPTEGWSGEEQGVRAAASTLPLGDGMVLLKAKLSGKEWPVVWVRHGRHGRVVRVILGSPADFGQASFVRMLCNALAWIG